MVGGISFYYTGRAFWMCTTCWPLVVPPSASCPDRAGATGALNTNTPVFAYTYFAIPSGLAALCQAAAGLLFLVNSGSERRLLYEWSEPTAELRTYIFSTPLSGHNTAELFVPYKFDGPGRLVKALCTRPPLCSEYRVLYRRGDSNG